MEMDRVSILGQIDDLPYLGGIEDRLLRNRHVPASVVQCHAHRLLNLVHRLVQRDTARLNSFALWQRIDGPKTRG